jgi:hypothetical protein
MGKRKKLNKSKKDWIKENYIETGLKRMDELTLEELKVLEPEIIIMEREYENEKEQK